MLSFKKDKDFTNVYFNQERIGAIRRRSSVYGWAMDIPDGWCFSLDLKEWKGNYDTRKLAALALHNVFTIKKTDNKK